MTESQVEGIVELFMMFTLYPIVLSAVWQIVIVPLTGFGTLKYWPALILLWGYRLLK